MGIPAHSVLASRKNVGFLAGFILLALGGALVWFGRGTFTSEKTIGNGTKQKRASTNLFQTVSGQTAKDTDGDGLQDWEETLWHTDPKNPDSDGDGTQDGKEITQNRDPLKRGPNDELTDLPTAIGDAGGGESQNLTYTLTKNLLESGVLGAIDQQGNFTSTDFLEKIRLPKTIDPDLLLASGVKISASDLIVSSKSDPETIKQYFLALTAIFQEHIAPHQQGGDIAILIEVFQSKDYERLAKLDPLIGALERTVAAVRRLPVPRGYERFAVQELDYLLETKRAVEIFRNTQNDPLATAVAIRRRIELLTEIANFHIETIRELRAKGIDLRS